MRPDTMPMHPDAMLMRSSALKTLRFYAKLYLVKLYQVKFNERLTRNISDRS